MDSIYGGHEADLQIVLDTVLKSVEKIRKEITNKRGMDPVEHVLGRIKSEESMIEKLHRRDFPETTEAALHQIKDAVGVRVVCTFLNDVYLIRDYLAGRDGYSVDEEKDYIRHVKPNGYRSYHLILRVGAEATGLQEDYYAEIQLRTISMDTWAALEHHLKYKKKVGRDEDLIVAELKRCADTLASTDISMQAIRDLIFEDGEDI